MNFQRTRKLNNGKVPIFPSTTKEIRKDAILLSVQEALMVAMVFVIVFGMLALFKVEMEPIICGFAFLIVVVYGVLQYGLNVRHIEYYRGNGWKK
jgi:membrane protein YdbS with pleckstrin-like domain